MTVSAKGISNLSFEEEIYHLMGGSELEWFKRTL